MKCYAKAIVLLVTFTTVVRTIPSIERCNRIISSCPKRLRLGPVCGSDGRTYSNECKLLRKACKKRRNLQKQHGGTCRSIDDVIQYTYKVYNPQNNDDSDSEEDVWPEIKIRLGQTHLSTSEVNSNNNIVQNGRHRNKNVEKKIREGRRQRRNKINKRRYVDLSGEQEKDEYDYGSSERRQRRKNQNRRRRKKIFVVEPTEQITTKYPTTIENTNDVVTKSTEPTVLLTSHNCERYCSPLLPKAPLCASNGKTYPSLCELEQDACLLKDPSITVEYDGPCSQAEGRKKCPQYCPLVFQPVCGSDGKTYPSSCWLSAVSCQKVGLKLTQLHTGRCKASIDSKNPERPICRRTCPTEFKRVCGSDGITYANECLLKLDSCKDPELTVVMQGPCPPKIR